MSNVGKFCLVVVGLIFFGAFMLVSSSPSPQASNPASTQERRSEFAEPSQMKHQVEALSKKEQIQLRENYARTIENKMLDAGMNADVSAEGDDATRLVIQYVLIDKVFVHQFDKGNGEVLAQARAAGFKKVTLTDGYEKNWDYDLTQ